jgi:hypothetical protein
VAAPFNEEEPCARDAGGCRPEQSRGIERVSGTGDDEGRSGDAAQVVAYVEPVLGTTCREPVPKRS